MSDAQTWTIIGVLAAAFASFIGLTINLLGRTLSAQLGSIRYGLERLGQRVDRLEERIDQRMERFEQRMQGFEQRMQGFELRMESLDRDVQAIAARVFRDDHGGRPA